MKRTQKEVSDSSRHWYQDKYQHVLTQRNMLALIALVALGTALVAVFAVLRLAPLKTVEPYLLQIDEKTGVTQKVNPITRRDYAASEAVDRYFTGAYLRARESYNINILRYNNNIVRLMSLPEVYRRWRSTMDPSDKTSVAGMLSTFGQRDVQIRSMAYITNPVAKNAKKDEAIPAKIMQVRIATIDKIPNQSDSVQNWIITLTFEYADLGLNEADQLLNPLGYVVTSYQIQKEIN